MCKSRDQIYVFKETHSQRQKKNYKICNYTQSIKQSLKTDVQHFYMLCNLIFYKLQVTSLTPLSILNKDSPLHNIPNDFFVSIVNQDNILFLITKSSTFIFLFFYSFCYRKAKSSKIFKYFFKSGKVTRQAMLLGEEYPSHNS